MSYNSTWMYLSFSRTSISMDCSSGTEMEQSVKTTRLSRDIGRGSWSLEANKRQAEASSCNWALINDNETVKTVVGNVATQWHTHWTRFARKIVTLTSSQKETNLLMGRQARTLSRYWTAERKTWGLHSCSSVTWAWCIHKIGPHFKQFYKNLNTIRSLFTSSIQSVTILRWLGTRSRWILCM